MPEPAPGDSQRPISALDALRPALPWIRAAVLFALPILVLIGLVSVLHYRGGGQASSGNDTGGVVPFGSPSPASSSAPPPTSAPASHAPPGPAPGGTTPNTPAGQAQAATNFATELAADVPDPTALRALWDQLKADPSTEIYKPAGCFDCGTGPDGWRATWLEYLRSMISSTRNDPTPLPDVAPAAIRQAVLAPGCWKNTPSLGAHTEVWGVTTLTVTGLGQPFQAPDIYEFALAYINGIGWKVASTTLTSGDYPPPPPCGTVWTPYPVS